MQRAEGLSQLSLARQIDALCDRFEKQWLAGEQPRLEEYLGALPPAMYPKLLAALLSVELELIRRAGGDPSDETYRRRFPNHTAVVSDVFATLSAKKTSDTSVQQESAHTGPLERGPAPPPSFEAEPLASRIGRFQVVAVLGEGAFGRVYRARDPQLNREVAIKVPFNSAIQTETDRERFLREARAAAGIHHPNVCPVHEVGEADGKPYIVMALIPGQSLAAMLKSRKEPLPEKQAAVIVRKLAQALDVAHKSSVVHRDLKPANVMFDRERKDVVVTDFGLARGPRLGDAQATQSGVIMGTPAYMSPEQARGDSKAVGPAADIYSLGIILYELLAGRRPFAGSITEIIGLILHVEPEPPSRYRPGIDPRLEAACMKAIAKDPADRFASMKEFAAAMDAVLRTPSGLSTETAKATRTETDDGSSTGTDTRRLADLFAAHASEQKQATEAAVERAVRKARTPPWVFVFFGVLLVGGLVALGGIIFFAKTKSATVLINVDVDLGDKTLSFFLDGKPIRAEDLAKPVELTLGEHELVVKRGNDVVKRIRFGVRGGSNPSIEIREVQEPSPPIPPKKGANSAEDGFVPLFNGKDLSGWNVIRTLQPPQVPLNNPEGWTVQDGALKCTSGEFLWLRSDREYHDFNLKLEVKLPVGGANGAVYLRNPGTKTGLDGFHVQIVPEQTPKGKQWPDTWRSGGIWNVVAPKVEAMRPLGEWNQLEIRCEGSKIRVTVNGSLTVDANADDFNELKDRPRSGFIGLANFQGEGKGIVYRNIRIKELKPTDPDRAAAEMVLAKKGTVRVDAGALPADPAKGWIDRPEDLPRGAFRLVGCRFRDQGTDDDLKRLSGLKGLRFIGLVDSPITDEGLKALRELPQLEHLQLDGTGITDAGLKHLQPLMGLKELHLNRTRVTPDAIERLQMALPNCKLAWDLPKNLENGFVPIFNGKDLTGWTSIRKLTVFSVDGEGNLVIAGDTKAVLTWLVTEKDYADFVLRLDFQFARGKGSALIDSGVAFRALPEQTGLSGAKLRVSLHNDQNFRHPLGAIVYTISDSIKPPKAAEFRPAGEWNALEIDATGPRIRVSVNGIIVNDVDLSKIDHSTISPKEGAARADLGRKSGRIGLQSHYGTIKYRNIRVKEISK